MMRQPINTALFSYWCSLKRDGGVPQRHEIDPGRISPYLAKVFLLELGAKGDVRFRLAGSDLCSEFGVELAGSHFLSLWHDGSQKRVASLLAEILETGDVGVLDATGAPDAVYYEIVLLPLISQTSIDRILGAAVRVGPGEPRGLATWTLSARTILSPDSHVPGPVSIRDARAAAAELAPTAQGPRPMRPKPRGRPVLRVLDGGLADPARQSGPTTLSTYANNIIGFTDG